MQFCFAFFCYVLFLPACFHALVGFYSTDNKMDGKITDWMWA